jgi:hypothetical protein
MIYTTGNLSNNPTDQQRCLMAELLAGAAVVNIDPPLPADPQGFVRRAFAVRDSLDVCQVRAVARRLDAW